MDIVHGILARPPRLPLQLPVEQRQGLGVVSDELADEVEGGAEDRSGFARKRPLEPAQIVGTTLPRAAPAARLRGQLIAQL